MPKLEKRTNLTPEILSSEGNIITILQFRDSDVTFYPYELLVKIESGQEFTVGLQKKSYTVDCLINLLGDNTDEWRLKKVLAVARLWNGTNVVRFEAIPASRQITERDKKRG